MSSGQTDCPPASAIPADTEHRQAFDSIALPRFASRGESRPFVAALEGGNGVGKTTLLHSLSTLLGAPSCLGTDPAWFSEAFKVRMIRDAQWYASAMFFLSGCFEQMRTLQARTEPLILMDRSLWSTLAVHAAQCTGRLESLIAMLGPIAGEVVVPDLTLVLDASFTSCSERIATKTGTARALDELTATARFHAREGEFYRWLARQAPGVVFIDAEAGPAQVAQRAAALIRERTRC